MLKGFTRNTPILEYKLHDIPVSVRRDDLMGDGYHLPPWGKIEGILELVKSRVDRNKPLTHLSVKGSWSGWALAAICDHLGIEFHYSYPNSKNFHHSLLEHVKFLYPNTKFNPMKPQLSKILYYQLRKMSEEKSWQMLNYGFQDEIYLKYLGSRISKVSGNYDMLCVSSGSGVNLSGYASGFDGDIYSTCVSSVKTISKSLKENNISENSVFRKIYLEKSPFSFDDPMLDYEVEFPCNQFWDKKQWYWLDKNIQKYKDQKILMINIGGIYNTKF